MFQFFVVSGLIFVLTGSDFPNKAFLPPAEEQSAPLGLIVGIALLLASLVCALLVICYLYTKLRSLDNQKPDPVPAKEADYDSDEYSVMMDWSEPEVKETIPAT